MIIKPRTNDTRRQLVVILIFFVFFTLFYTLQSVAINLRVYGKPDFINSLLTSLIHWFPWIPVAFFVLLLVRKFPPNFKKWYLTIPLHIFLGIMFSLLHGVLYVSLFFLIFGGSGGSFQDILLSGLIKAIHLNFFTYVLIVSLAQMWSFHRKNIRNELRESELKSQLSQAQMQRLASQLNPHFLFNTLHTITAQMRNNPQGAESMMSLLSDLLRKSLEKSECHFIPLKEELELIQIYLEIWQIRFQNKLRVEYQIDPASLFILVPNLILQPLVENALQHGITTLAGGGKLTVYANKEDGELFLRIKDTGPGFQKDTEKLFLSGMGLKNCRKRLRLLYGDRALFQPGNNPEGGAMVEIRIPAQEYKNDNTSIDHR